MSGDGQEPLPQGFTMEIALRPVIPTQRTGVLLSLRAIATTRHNHGVVDTSGVVVSLTQGEIEVLRNSIIRSSANIWDNVIAFVRQYTRFLDVSPRSIREFFVSEVLKASAPTWKCGLFANEGIKDEEFWDVHEGSLEDLRALLTIAQFRAVKQRLESEIDRCWAEVAKEMALLTGREFEIGDVKALYEQHHGGKPGAEAGIIGGMARMEV